MQGRHIEPCPRCRHERCQLENQQEISGCPVVLVYLPATVHAAQNLDGVEVLHQASGRLQDNQHIGDKADDTVRGRQACMVTLVDLDGKEGHDEPEQAERLDGVMDAGPSSFLGGQAGWLENQICLDLQQECERVQKLWYVSGIQQHTGAHG